MIAQLGSRIRVWQVNVVIVVNYIGNPFIRFPLQDCYTVNY